MSQPFMLVKCFSSSSPVGTLSYLSTHNLRSLPNSSKMNGYPLPPMLPEPDAYIMLVIFILSFIQTIVTVPIPVFNNRLVGTKATTLTLTKLVICLGSQVL